MEIRKWWKDLLFALIDSNGRIKAVAIKGIRNINMAILELVKTTKLSLLLRLVITIMAVYKMLYS